MKGPITSIAIVGKIIIVGSLSWPPTFVHVAKDYFYTDGLRTEFNGVQV